MGPVSVVPIGTGDDRRRTVVYDSGHTNPIVVRVDNASVRVTEGSSEAMLSSPSTGDHLQKWKKDKKKRKKRRRRHSSVSSPGGKLARRADRWSA